MHIFRTPFTKNTCRWLLFEVQPHDLHDNYLKSIKLEAAIHRFYVKSYSGKFRKIHGKTSMSMSLLLQLSFTRRPAQVVLLNVKNFFRTSFLQNTSGWMFLDLRKFVEYFRKMLVKQANWCQILENVKDFRLLL